MQAAIGQGAHVDDAVEALGLLRGHARAVPVEVDLVEPPLLARRVVRQRSHVLCRLLLPNYVFNLLDDALLWVTDTKNVLARHDDDGGAQCMRASRLWANRVEASDARRSVWPVPSYLHRSL